MIKKMIFLLVFILIFIISSIMCDTQDLQDLLYILDTSVKKYCTYNDDNTKALHYDVDSNLMYNIETLRYHIDNMSRGISPNLSKSHQNNIGLFTKIYDENKNLDELFKPLYEFSSYNDKINEEIQSYYEEVDSILSNKDNTISKNSKGTTVKELPVNHIFSNLKSIQTSDGSYKTINNQYSFDGMEFLYNSDEELYTTGGFNYLYGIDGNEYVLNSNNELELSYDENLNLVKWIRIQVLDINEVVDDKQLSLRRVGDLTNDYLTLLDNYNEYKNQWCVVLDKRSYKYKDKYYLLGDQKVYIAIDRKLVRCITSQEALPLSWKFNT